MEAVVPNAWPELADHLASRPGVFLLLGATDRGKSTLVGYLARSLLSRGITVSVVDADIGQSSLCLPGTVSFSAFSSVHDLQDFRCRRFSFTGSVTPLPVFSFLIRQACRFVSLGRIASHTTLVDTTGLVEGEAGIRLKIAKIRSIRPDGVISLERENELQPILHLIQEVEILPLEPSPFARKRSREQRLQRRNARLEEYFREGKERVIPTRSIEMFFNGRGCVRQDLRIRQGSVVGLNRDDDSEGLGIITELGDDAITLKTPLHSLKGIKRVMAGSLIYGEESAG